MPSRLLRKSSALALATSLYFGASSQAAPVHCPEQLNVDQRAVDLPTGLSAFDSANRHLWANVQFSDGAPDQQAWLAPDHTRPTGKSFTSHWQFTPTTGGIWLACGYTGTSMVAAFRLPDAIRTCEVRYDGNVSPPAATAIDCR